MTWRYGVCGLLLLATMLLYMDRLTLSVLAKRICDEYSFTNEEYGSLDSGLSYAFAAGAFFFGFLVDRLGPRWLYPGVVIAWSCAGLATAHSDAIGAGFRPPTRRRANRKPTTVSSRAGWRSDFSNRGIGLALSSPRKSSSRGPTGL